MKSKISFAVLFVMALAVFAGAQTPSAPTREQTTEIRRNCEQLLGSAKEEVTFLLFGKRVTVKREYSKAKNKIRLPLGVSVAFQATETKYLVRFSDNSIFHYMDSEIKPIYSTDAQLLLQALRIGVGSEQEPQGKMTAVGLVPSELQAWLVQTRSEVSRQRRIENLKTASRFPRWP